MNDQVFTAIVVGLFFGAIGGGAFVPMAEGAVKRWIETRHEYRMRLLSHRERWLEVDAARPRAGEWRSETKGGES